MSRVVAIALCVLAGSAVATVGFDNCSKTLINGYVPQMPANSVKICRDGEIAIAYDKDMVNPAYSAYYVTPDNMKTHISGRDGFYEDPDLKDLGIKQAAVDSDAFNTSWNRGHCCPNNIMSFSPDSKKATFTMANVAPQAAYFNQHPWQYLENDVISWITDHVALHMVTGVAYKSRTNARRTYDGIAVPDYYFKVLCDVTNGESVGFLGDNNGDGEGTAEMRTVEDVEKVYGGYLVPFSTCNPHRVNTSHWWPEDKLAKMPHLRININRRV
uniref:DNA/RNA non-specific endonuclease domain-containing protein n=1 Tax=Neobodo designis TaxID=312471 RepID=A0A7S1MIY8_NEODS|eukprot:CAMPEP_0174829902 /NCGR_PEP_ID=MMETSP1114-20130205/2220_1 /TAXON_ID=312471 /ORGANISM="Neobodo designis, Strain CCAP 1951/1" /LENGTH=270 /DNA_ID=CAMNT_0016063679 /DNA_START=28 /DNA_END=840 /DNA_ORIENTATION=-